MEYFFVILIYEVQTYEFNMGKSVHPFFNVGWHLKRGSNSKGGCFHRVKVHEDVGTLVIINGVNCNFPKIPLLDDGIVAVLVSLNIFTKV